MGLAYVLPFAAFMGGLALVGLLGWLGGEEGPFWLTESRYWVFPLQVLVCSGVLVWFWRSYDWGPWLRTSMEAIFWGVVVFLFWVSPQLLFGVPARTDGFNPWVLGESGWVVWLTLGFRLFRLIVVVPFLEEIFWRGFLMRYFIDDGNWQKIAFGTARLGSFSAVVILFAFVHDFTDFFGALVAGVVFNAVAIRTKSLGACVLAHAVTNGLLGIYILATRQWGFW